MSTILDINYLIQDAWAVGMLGIVGIGLIIWFVLAKVRMSKWITVKGIVTKSEKEIETINVWNENRNRYEEETSIVSSSAEVTYTYNGVEYTKIFNTGSCPWKEGKEKKFKLDPNNPNEPVHDDIYGVLLIIGIIFIFVSILAVCMMCKEFI